MFTLQSKTQMKLYISPIRLFTWELAKIM